ncbi:hypothetical protein SELMODRAFT_408081 [Selaginella moellendorffii]|uniref:Uncharacterized protein n=1 Tax=Selaginella moellendorffii TaxID=88036 RepID=D8R748_SELML|nr:hypothetical protein SELMODRAFT_408081 [Selaginella moellendorffii]
MNFVFVDLSVLYESLSHASQKSARKFLTKATVNVGPLMSGHVSEAKSVFDVIPQPNTISTNLITPRPSRRGRLLGWLLSGGRNSAEDPTPSKSISGHHPVASTVSVPPETLEFISAARAPKSAEGYASIGGGSPLRRITEEQARLDSRIPFSYNISYNLNEIYKKNFRKHLGLTRLSNMQHTVIPLWYQREGVKAMASLIEKEFSKFSNSEDIKPWSERY